VSLDRRLEEISQSQLTTAHLYTAQVTQLDQQELVLLQAAAAAAAAAAVRQVTDC